MDATPWIGTGLRDTVTMDIESNPGSKRATIQELGFSPSFEFLAAGEGAAQRLLHACRINQVEFSKVNYTRNGTQILFDVSGAGRSGEVLAILGPSKSGKTKLLNSLAGTIQTSSSKHQSLEGGFAADGERLFAVLRAGFVPKHEHLVAVATVKEELEFSATLRLPKEVSQEDRQAIVDDVMRSLGFENDANTLVKKLTNGQRKLLAIGIELASLPNVLFLDEPTSGLDPSSAWKVVAALNGLAASKACAVVCTLVQPSSEIFALLTRIVLLCQGHTIYSGHAEDLTTAFAAKGLHCPTGHSIGDFALLCTRELSLDSLPSTISTSHLQKSPLLEKRIVDNKKPSVHPVVHGTEIGQFDLRPRHRSFLVQFNMLLLRELRATRREPRLFTVRIVSSLVIFAISACVFLYTGDLTNPNYFIGSHFGGFAFTVFSSCFGVMIPNVLVISDVKGSFVRERALNFYGSLPYALAKMIPEVVINLIVAVLLVLFMYWSALWHGNFGLLIVPYWLLFLSCTSYAYLVTLGTSKLEVALGLTAVLLAPQLLFMGTFVRISSLPIWLQWVSYICNIDYALRFILVVELDPNNCGGDPKICATWAGLVQANIAQSDALWWYALVLVGFFLVFRVLAFVLIQRRIHQSRRFGEL